MTEKILLTGASGYVGGRLLKLLESSDKNVRCLARNEKFLKDRVSSTTEIVKGDLLDKKTLEGAFRGVNTAYYLVHSMGSKKEFEKEDRIAASNFADEAKKADVKKIIYLGGLGDSSTRLSKHLQSRQEVGEILRQSGINIIEFRAAVIIGSGSLSFEMIRALVEKLPVMITPRWVSVKTQPIFIEDLLKYLVKARSLSVNKNLIFEIGGKDVVTYADMINEYARIRRLKRLMLPIPVLTPYLSSLWLGLVTPLYARVGRKLIDSIENPTVVKDNSVNEYIKIETKGMKEAFKSALNNEDREFAQTRWSDSISSSGNSGNSSGLKFGTRIIDSYENDVDCNNIKAFKPILEIGGKKGWYYANWLWKIRGFLDLLAGGVGIRRGRPDPLNLSVGDTIDWWRVEQYEKNSYLRLYAEMKVPGRAWLEFKVIPKSTDTSVIKMTALFDPLGLFGRLYWYVLYPLHVLVFRGMIRKISEKTI